MLAPPFGCLGGRPNGVRQLDSVEKFGGAMAVTKRTIRPWVPGEIAAQRMVDATIELLTERRFSEVNTRDIAERAGLYKQLISRHFGSLDGLFIEVVHQLMLRGLDGFDGTRASLEKTQKFLDLRSRLIAWLVTSGVEPLSIVPEEDQDLFRQLMRSRVPALSDGVPPRAVQALSSIVGLLNHAGAVFAPTIHGVTPQDVQDVQLLMSYLLQHLGDAAEHCGWTEGVTASKSAGKKSK